MDMHPSILIRRFGTCSKVAIAICLCLAVAIVCATFYRMRSAVTRTTERYEYECPMHLEDVGDLIMIAVKKSDRITQDLTSLTNLLPCTPSQLRWRTRSYLCPAVQSLADPKRAGSFGYTYLDWSSRQFARIEDVPGDYPLVYDNAYSNHLNRGIYVLKVDGSVIWDAGGAWLLEFSHTHPEYHIVVPQ